MSALFVWQIIAETEREVIEFPKQISLHKVTDDEIRTLIADVCDKFEVVSPANFIYNLTFLATDGNKNTFLESLSPFDFWPILPLMKNSRNKDKFRATKEGEK